MLTLKPTEINSEAVEWYLCDNAVDVSRVCRSRKIEDCE